MYSRPLASISSRSVLRISDRDRLRSGVVALGRRMADQVSSDSTGRLTWVARGDATRLVEAQ